VAVAIEGERVVGDATEDESGRGRDDDCAAGDAQQRLLQAT
jgi:hypothetical protein